MENPPSLTFISVATNRYVAYWMNLARSIEYRAIGFATVDLVVFTDDVDQVAVFSSELKRVNVIPIETPNLCWPDATLLRYQLISDYGPGLLTDILCHVDADMLLVRDLHPAMLQVGAWIDGIALVAHPAFTKDEYQPAPAPFQRFARRVKSGVGSLLLGGRGAWETRRESKAFVPRGQRSRYVCGGIWFGANASFLAMCEELADRVSADSEAGIVAKWHDESHLNWYASVRNSSILGSEFCCPEGARLLEGRRPVFVAIDKGLNRTR